MSKFITLISLSLLFSCSSTLYMSHFDDPNFLNADEFSSHDEIVSYIDDPYKKLFTVAFVIYHITYQLNYICIEQLTAQMYCLTSELQAKNDTTLL